MYPVTCQVDHRLWARISAEHLVLKQALLDAMPVRSVPLGRMRDWPVRDTVEETVHAWLAEAREALCPGRRVQTDLRHLQRRSSHKHETRVQMRLGPTRPRWG